MLADRLEITGELVLKSHLHLGTGAILPGSGGADGDDDQPTVRAVARDAGGKPLLPGTGIKGALRKALSKEAADRLFGWAGEREAETGAMGRLWIRCAPLVKGGVADPGSLKQAREQSPDGFTKAQTRIDRNTRSAETRLLYHHEMVPKDSRFKFAGTWFCERLAEISDDDLAYLGQVVSVLRGDPPLFLGAGSRLGDGQVAVDPKTLRFTGYALSDRTGELDVVDTVDLERRLRAACKPPPVTGARRHYYELALCCDGPFLSLRERSEESRRRTGAQVQPLMFQGQPVLWPTSLIGALRARAAWIAECARLTDDPHNQGTYRFGRRKRPTPMDDRDLTVALGGRTAVTAREDVLALSSVEKLFGVAGWRGCLGLKALDWDGAPEPEMFDQTSVSIDRFTGGARDTALFKTRAVLNARFKATLFLENRGDLLCRSERDLLDLLWDSLTEEGLFLGHGAAKGFGWFQATVTASDGEPVR